MADNQPVNISDFFDDAQHDGFKLRAAEIAERTRQWIAERNAENLVTDQQIEIYAMNVARWIQAEQSISKFGFLTKNPNTGAPIPSPLTTISSVYSKAASDAWKQIYNCVKGCVKEEEDEDDSLETLRIRIPNR